MQRTIGLTSSEWNMRFFIFGRVPLKNGPKFKPIEYNFKLA